jgi:hypothetical protein
MPRARRRRLQRQRKKWGVQPKRVASPVWSIVVPLTVSPVARVTIGASSDMPAGAVRVAFTVPLSRLDLLALAASAKNPAERRRYRKMLEAK